VSLTYSLVGVVSASGKLRCIVNRTAILLSVSGLKNLTSKTIRTAGSDPTCHRRASRASAAADSLHPDSNTTEGYLAILSLSGPTSGTNVISACLNDFLYFPVKLSYADNPY